MRIAPHQRTDYPTAKQRALVYLAKQHRLTLSKASSVGCVIWPGSEMRSQGLGGAASRILRKMQDEGLVKWTPNADDWGWAITATGRALAERAK